MKTPLDMPGERPKMNAAEGTLVCLLGELQKRFYVQVDQSLFYRDRRALAKALSWPALWLDHRGVYCSQARYRALLVARLEAIEHHGVTRMYGAYFPAYLLKCLQDWFAWHGEELYLELKHARNAIEVALLSVGFDDESGEKPRCDRRAASAVALAKVDQDPIVALAGLHRVLGAKTGSEKSRSEQNQILLKLS